MSDIKIVNQPTTLALQPKKVTTLDKAVNAVKENTADGTFIGDNMLLTGAGGVVGATAAVAGVAKLADKYPAIEKAIEFTFVENAGVVFGSAALGTSAILGEDAVASYKEGDKGKAAALAAGALTTGLAGTEMVGRQYNIPVAKEALTTPLKTAYNHKEAIAGAALIGVGATVIKDGVDNLKEGNSMLGGAEVLGGAVATLGGAELVGRRYNIPVAKQALSTPAEFVANNVKAITGTAAVAGGTAAIVKGVKDVKAGKNLQGGAEIAGGAVGVLGGAELIGREYNIPVMKEALTGTAKAIFTSKGGIIASGSVIGASGLAAAADGVRRLTTEKGIINDAIGVAEVTAGVAGATGGASLVGYAIGNEKLMRAFPENATIIGGTALLGGAVALGKFTADDIKENGFEMTHVASGTGAALMAMGATEIIADKLGVPVLDKAFTKGYQPVAAIGLGAASYKLGEIAVDQGKQFVKAPSTGRGLLTAGAATGTVLVGAGSVALAGKSLGIPVMEKAGMTVLNGVRDGVVTSAEFVGEKVAAPVFNFAVKNPGITLGALAVAAGASYYIYHQNKEEKAGN